MIKNLVFANSLLACSILSASAPYRPDLHSWRVRYLAGVYQQRRRCCRSYFTQTQAFGFTYSNGVVQQVGSSQTGWLRPLDINNNGDIVGQASTAAFILSGATGELSLYSNPGCLVTTFWGMNDTGSIVGDCFNPTAATTAFLFENGAFDATVPPIDQMGPVRDINNGNQVVSVFDGLADVRPAAAPFAGGFCAQVAFASATRSVILAAIFIP